MFLDTLRLVASSAKIQKYVTRSHPGSDPGPSASAEQRSGLLSAFTTRFVCDNTYVWTRLAPCDAFTVFLTGSTLVTVGRGNEAHVSTAVSLSANPRSLVPTPYEACSLRAGKNAHGSRAVYGRVSAGRRR